MKRSLTHWFLVALCSVAVCGAYDSAHAAGKLSDHVHAAYPLDRAAEALRSLKDRAVMGKVVLNP